MTSILRRPSPPRFDPGLDRPRQQGNGSGLAGLAALLTLTVLVAAGIDAIALNGSVMKGLREQASPAVAGWERTWRHYRAHPYRLPATANLRPSIHSQPDSLAPSIGARCP